MVSRQVCGRRFASLGPAPARPLDRLSASTASLHVAPLGGFTTRCLILCKSVQARHGRMSALCQKQTCSALAHVRFGPIADIQDARFEALKMYLLLLKKYLPASFKRSNSSCHSIRSLAETSSLPPTKFRTNSACPLL